MSQPDPMSFFHLKPIRVARVSEISEATASAPVPVEERVNFHIGNPLQDPRLSSAYLRILLGLDIHREDLNILNPDAILDALGWDPEERPKLQLLNQMLLKSSPYMPRGGYSRQDPHALIELFCSWMSDQQESLTYDTGDQSGKREVILASGGVTEALRVVLFVISTYLEALPARILTYQCDLPARFYQIPNLQFINLASEEDAAKQQIEEIFSQHPDIPTFLLPGAILKEETRRWLRLLSIEKPLFFIEANDAPNHLSLAREAKLVDRVIRILSPAIFSPRLGSQSTVFIIGNADFLKVIENVHFKFKGTPSASEIEFLIYLLGRHIDALQPPNHSELPKDKPMFDGLGFGISAETSLPRLSERIEQQLDRFIEGQSGKLDRSLHAFTQRAAKLDQQVQHSLKSNNIDEFIPLEAHELLDLMIENIDDPVWGQSLQRSFLNQFNKHHPQYQPDACLVASGSSRTALGILGFHCGITEVVIPDLSWSYEQCFENVHTVPLTPSLDLDVEATIEKLEDLRKHDPSWHTYGAMVISSPHNATGQIFSSESIGQLMEYCLDQGLYVIDDLAYQNVAPSIEFPNIQTARMLANELVRSGVVSETKADRLITAHSLSKTDSFAGARLAVLEIRDKHIRQKFEDYVDFVQPNLAAIFISYLFYRQSEETLRTYWHLRNIMFFERSRALLTAVNNLPEDRNKYGLSIIPPKGSMYPLLIINFLPSGLSLEWLASSLARRGIGLLPLSTFARTEEGYEHGRKTFRLTLGGVDNAEVILAKTRRLLIDLNRLIEAEEAEYNRRQLTFTNQTNRNNRALELSRSWNFVSEKIIQHCRQNRYFSKRSDFPNLDSRRLQEEFFSGFLPERLDVFHTRLLDRAKISDELVHHALTERGGWFPERLEKEFYKDSLERRQELFRMRSYDRTVHPTQMYSLHAELALDALSRELIYEHPVAPQLIDKAAEELVKEYFGFNVNIRSQDEPAEIKLDLAALTAAEDYADLFSTTSLPTLLSFWSDWDGSNRPSGQGHQFIGAVVMENVQRMSRIIRLLRQADPNIQLQPEILSQISQLPDQNQHFTQILNSITLLTHQLELRYRGILPFSMESSPLKQMAMRWKIWPDPVRVLWQHNDRNERKMLDLRQQRRGMLEHYFALNKELRKQLRTLIPEILQNRSSEELLREVVGYRDLLQRTLITPRIHQGLITARDQFGIDTTVFNLNEINTISGKYGNPGIVLALQVSMSSQPEALISLDRKFRRQRDHVQRENDLVELPSIWLIPLFEQLKEVKEIGTYLNRVWDYSSQSRHSSQSPQKRFAEIISEVFIAGSDLSQQVSQATSSYLYRKVSYELQTWLAEHGVAEDVRIKLGSGEPMQRQGGYYSSAAGKPAIISSNDSKQRFQKHLPPAARQSTSYAVTPLQGIFKGGDLQTFQSNLSEQLRYLPVGDFVNLLYHVREAQGNRRANLIRAAETITESRMGAKSRNIQELERLTIGFNDTQYEEFLEELTDNFRHILYGQEEDVIGVHAISYFIGRSLPQLRDRPSSRKTSGSRRNQGQQILASIAETIPLENQGSLLRAISHNQSQTVVLGVNQLTTGLFRALDRYSQKSFGEAERQRMIAERLLPKLPVYEILHTLRIFHDWRGEFLARIETAFPAGNSAFVALREDGEAMRQYLPLFQEELLRCQGLNVNDFFSRDVLIPGILPTLRPDLAVLLQRDLFNTELDVMLKNVDGKVSREWQEETSKLLELPKQIHHWRSIIWDVLEDSLYQRVQSFAELAVALYSLPGTHSVGASPAIISSTKLPSSLTDFFRTAQPDDEMRNFLAGTLEYLNTFLDGTIEAPIAIIRAMDDVERIAQIEETALPAANQDLIRFCLLQIARLAKENG